MLSNLVEADETASVELEVVGAATAAVLAIPAPKVTPIMVIPARAFLAAWRCAMFSFQFLDLEARSGAPAPKVAGV